MLEHAEFLIHVVNPDDIRIGRTRLNGNRLAIGAGGSHEVGLVSESLITIGHAFHVQADDLAAIGRHVGAVSDDRRTGADAEVFPVIHLARAHLGRCELPQELAGLLFENHHDAAVANVLIVARAFIVGAHIDTAIGDDRRTIGLRAELRHPEAVLGGAHVHVFRRSACVSFLSVRTQTARDLRSRLGPKLFARINLDRHVLLGRDHVAVITTAPLGMIGSSGRQSHGSEDEERSGRSFHRQWGFSKRLTESGG